MTSLGSSPPLVLLFVPTLGGGGAERVFLTLLERIPPSRFHCELVVASRTGALAEQVPAHIPVHDLGKRFRFTLPALVQRMRKLIVGRRPAAVVSAIWYADLISLLARRRGDPWHAVVSVHSLAQGIYTDRFGAAKGAIMERLYPRASAAVCVADAVARDFARAFQRDGAPPVSVVPNPVDLDRVAALARQTGAPARRRAHRLVGVGRLEPVKGFDIAIEALAQLSGHIDVELVLVGSGPEEARLRQRAGDLGVADRVRFTGFTDNPYVVMASADVLVAPSRLEAASLVTIEALSLGVPIVVTDAPGSAAEIAGFGACGRVVPMESPQALASACLELLDDPDLRTRLGEAGLGRVGRHHPSVAVPLFEDRLADILAGAPP